MDRYPISPQFLQKYLTGEYTVPEKEEVEKWYSSLSGTPDQIRVLPASSRGASSRAASSRTIGRRWWDSPASANFLVWWDGDLTRELLDGNHIDKYRPNGPAVRLLTAEGCSSNNGTKSTPALSADLFGYWREEVVLRTEDNQSLRIYTTTIPTDHRLYTLMQDPQYRLSIVWQNVGCNQPPHPSFFLGHGMKKPLRPKITFISPN